MKEDFVGWIVAFVLLAVSQERRRALPARRRRSACPDAGKIAAPTFM
jgi:hypothetical protein